MAAYRLSTFRSLLRQPLTNPRLGQRRWARVLDVRYLATHSNPDERVFAKYKAQLESKAREKGLKDVSELKEAYKEKIQQLRSEAAVPGATAPLTPPPSPSPTSTSTSTSTPTSTHTTSTQPQKSPCPAPPSPPSAESTSAPQPPPGVKTLNSFLDVPKISTLSNTEIETLWRLRHAHNERSLHFTLPASTFTTLLETAKRHPSFILPLPREVPNAQTEVSQSPASHQAAELHYLQFTHPHPHTTTLLFTTLAEFKLRGEFATPHTTVSFHSELAESHALVLGQGEIMENKGVSVDDARWLVMCMQKFYVVSGGGEEGAKRGELLDLFTRGDEGFRVERLLEEAEKIL